MELEFDRSRWSSDSEGFWLCLRVKAAQAARQFVGAMADRPYIAQIREKRGRRSLDANAYCWVLLDKLAVELSKGGVHKSPEEVYRDYIPHVGGNSKILPIREDAIDGWMRIWGAGRTGWVCEDMGECQTLLGYHNIRCFYGSSIYDTAQMSRLLDLIIQDCRQLGIETKTPDELALMKARWADAQADKGG